MFSTRKISAFFLGISAVSMSLFTVSFPTAVADDNWPWGTPSQYSVADGRPGDGGIAAEDDNWPWGKSADAADDDNWPWGDGTDGVSGSAPLA